MAKAIANCRCKNCGKIFEKIEFRRNQTEADNWKDWAEKNFDMCHGCYHEEIVKEAAEAAQASGFPELIGSPKQIAWAEQIRQKLWKDYQEEEKAYDSYSDRLTPEQAQQWENMKSNYRNLFQSIISAKEYIDSRYQSAITFVQRHMILNLLQELNKYKMMNS